MPKFRNLICFLSHVFLVYITILSSSSGGLNDLVFSVTSCDASGIIHATRDSKVKSVLVECNHNKSDTLEAVNIDGINFTISGCPINKPVKILIFNETHEWTAGSVLESHSLIKETTVVCNGSKVAVKFNFSNSPLSPTAVTSIPLTNGLTIKVTESNGTNSVTNVDIEHKYKLKITGPANMYILVESCDAASNSDFSEHNVSLYASRKPNDDYGVLNKFSDDAHDGKPSEAVSVMNGFRLLGSPVVYLRCFVDVCKDAGCPSLTTTTTTPVGRRRRRNVDIPNRKVTLSTSFRVKSSFTTSRANGYTAGDERYVVLASLLLTKMFFDRY